VNEQSTLARWIQRKRKGGICFETTCVSWRDLLIQIEQFEKEASNLTNSRVGVVAESPTILLALLAAFSEHRINVTLLPADNSDPESFSKLTALWPVDVVLRAPRDAKVTIEYCGSRDAPTGISQGGLTIYSSGTTGIPLPRTWTWSALNERLYISPSVHGGTWLCAYSVVTFAGIQAILHACAAAETFVLLRPTASLSSALQWASRFTLAMATPTFWRRCLLTERLDRLRDTIDVISLGGEPATQELLDGLRRVFEHTRLVHVYASSEYGSLFSVADGRAGFPSAWLGRPLRCGATLAIFDNELYVLPAAGQAYLATGDAVRIEGPRVVFDGRVAESINVGGQKVSPIRIESALRSIEGIADARVYAISSAVTGQLVAADLVVQNGYEMGRVRNLAQAYFRKHLAPPERPRKIRFVNQIQVTNAGKIARL